MSTSEQIKNALNANQLSAVETIDGPVLILAGAGSGKTRVLTYRIAHMMQDEGISPRNILAITFTNKAAKEMLQRAQKLVGADMAPTLCTFHSFGYQILKDNYDKLGFSRRIHISDDTDSIKRLKKIVANHGLEDKGSAKDIQDFISWAKDHLYTPEDIKIMNRDGSLSIEMGSDDCVAINPTFISVYEEYQKGLFEDNLVDFDDLIMLPTLLFRDNRAVLEQYQEKYQYLMVDEYQDTSHAQFMLVHLLAQKYRNICVVGDDYQSIYKFRGADIHNILSFQETYPEAKVVTLGENYRSTQNIVDAAALLIQNNPNQMHKELKSMQEEGNLIHVSAEDNPDAEARHVAEQINELLYRGVKPEEIAILYRKNALSRAFEEALLREHIPYRIYGGLSFYSRAEIKDMLAYLALFSSNPVNTAIERVINVPKRGIGNKSVEKLMAEASKAHLPLLEYILLPSFDNKPNGVSTFHSLIVDIKNYIENMQPTLDQLINYIFDHVDYIDYLRSQATKRGDENTAENKYENVMELVNVARTYSSEHYEMSLIEQIDAFIDDVALMTDQDTQDSDGAISLMTMHRSKGLEFEHVFVGGCEEGMFPDGRDEMEVEEERRLCYVAMTRAKKELYMSYCSFRMLYGRVFYPDPSRFLVEIADYTDNSAKVRYSNPRNRDFDFA